MKSELMAIRSEVIGAERSGSAKKILKRHTEWLFFFWKLLPADTFATNIVLPKLRSYYLLPQLPAGSILAGNLSAILIGGYVIKMSMPNFGSMRYLNIPLIVSTDNEGIS